MLVFNPPFHETFCCVYYLFLKLYSCFTAVFIFLEYETINSVLNYSELTS